MFSRTIRLCAAALTAALLLALAALMLPPALAEDLPTEGDIEGTAVHWAVAGGTLTLTGTGDLPDYYTGADMFGYAQRPWEHLTPSIRSLVIGEGITGTGVYVFPNMTSLTSVVMADSVRTLGSGSFQGCSSLIVLRVGEGVESIGSTCFQRCSGLTAVSLPKSLRTVGRGAFDGCSSLQAAIYPGTEAEFAASVAVEQEGNDLLVAALRCSDTPATAGLLGESASWSFSGGVLTVRGTGDLPDFPASAAGDRPFASFASDIRALSLEGGITSIGAYLFTGLPAVTTLTLPDGITDIGEGAFSSCAALSQVSLPGTLKSVGKNAFANCPSLIFAVLEMTEEDLAALQIAKGNEALENSLNISEPPLFSGTLEGGITWERQAGKLTLRGEGAISDGALPERFRNIDRLVIDEGITAIGSEAFAGFAMREVRLPRSLASVGQRAFTDCANLTNALYSGSAEEWSGVAVAEGNEPLTAVLAFADEPDPGPIGGLGDINRDGSVNSLDRTYLARALAGWGGYPLPDAAVADLNRDGRVNSLDRTYLARALAGWADYPL